MIIFCYFRLPAKLGFPFALSLSKGSGKPLWFDKLTTNGFPYFGVLQEVFCISIAIIFLFLFLTKIIKPWRDYYDYLEYKNFILKKGVDKIDDLSSCHYDYFDVKFPQHNKVMTCLHCKSQRLVDANDLPDMPLYKKAKEKDELFCFACQNTAKANKNLIPFIQNVALPIVCYVAFLPKMTNQGVYFVAYFVVYLFFMLLLQFIDYKQPVWKIKKTS